MAKTKRKSVDRVKTQVSEPILAWVAPEFIRYERTWKWYVLAGLFNALLIAYALYSNSWSMAMVMVVLGIVVIVDIRRKPEAKAVAITEWGVQFGDLKMPYNQIKQFWIHHQPPHTDELRFKTHSRIHPEVTIPLNGANPSLIRQVLVTQVPEWEGKQMSFLDILSRVLKLH